MVNTIETRGLGAGSYPEAPELPEEGARCERCGWHRGLKEVDGQLPVSYTHLRAHET